MLRAGKVVLCVPLAGLLLGACVAVLRVWSCLGASVKECGAETLASCVVVLRRICEGVWSGDTASSAWVVLVGVSELPRLLLRRCLCGAELSLVWALLLRCAWVPPCLTVAHL